MITQRKANSSKKINKYLENHIRQMLPVGKGRRERQALWNWHLQGNLMGRLQAGEAENPPPASELVKK